ncbi:hypothetical protein [Kutzneria buriramensis]|uniref:Antimicrobial peptide system SdpA family protein n=1 Tax=Kutzneria buriramensis TaxID=1045776 RepID=A0A3E0GZJ6_9PSEU|nr:hypothetical protein [Kutzneria buriramensis]REH35774.1 hypothetical protein BCF44_117162 [Kutzneria buriramensis]
MRIGKMGSSGSPAVVGYENEHARRGFGLTLTILLVSLLISMLAQWGGGIAPDLVGDHLGAYAVIWPQGWSFFTDLSGKNVLTAYRVSPDGMRLTLETQRQEWSDFTWGLDRAGDSAAFEITQLAQEVPDRYWRACEAANPAECGPFLPTSSNLALTNSSTTPTLCGPTVIAIDRPNFPPSGDLPTSPRRVARVALVNLTCAR